MKVSELKGNWVAVAEFQAMDFQGFPFTLENREAIKSHMFKQLEAQGGKPYESGGNVCVEGSGQFWRLPTLPAKREGIIEFKSKHYEFSSIDFKNGTPSRGDKPKADCMLDNGFILETPQGRIVYTLKHKL